MPAHADQCAAAAVPTAPPAPTQAPPSSGAPKLLFGIGAEADSAIKTRLVQRGAGADADQLVQQPERPELDDRLEERPGAAILRRRLRAAPDRVHRCARGADSDQVRHGLRAALPALRSLPGRYAPARADLRRRGNGPPLYVTLFTEFQTYACTDNAWNPNAADQRLLPRAEGSLPGGAGGVPPARAERQGLARLGRLADALGRPVNRRRPLDVPVLRRRDARLGFPELPGHAERQQRRRMCARWSPCWAPTGR